MFSTDAIILKKTDAGEADALVTLYTREFGKIRARAQGVKKEEAKLRGHCEPINHVQAGFVIGKHGERLTHAVVVRSWPGIRSGYEKLAAAAILGETVDRECFPGEKDEALWGFLIASLEELETGAAENFLPRFKQQFARVLGDAR